VLRLLNYPPLPVLKPGMTWAGEHTDYGILTILWSPNSGGLQAKNRAGRWLDVDAAPDTFVINIGDLMMNWTNDRWVSTLHRVVPTSGDTTRRRQSIPFFYNPNPDALIECLPTCTDAQHPPKYVPILARDHLQMKIDKAVKA
jgi:isopenicillin N synthase-like dioxygenase